VCRRWWPDVLCREFSRPIPAVGRLRRQNLKRHKGRRNACATTDEVRIHRQSQNRQADRPDDPSQRAGEGGQSDQVKKGPSEECRMERAGKNMKRKITVLALSAMLFALCGSVDAQQSGKIFRIGILDSSTASGSAILWEAFQQELRKFGWIEGKNI